ncbi:MAG: FAD-binding oxidoreductase [Kiloniellales bacterium]|nr:FAD-binding oxidoreductase [Kiloniellales bacterium]
MRLEERELTAWGGTCRTRSLTAEAASLEDCQKVLEIATDKGMTIAPRGHACSHADACLNNGEITIDLQKFNRILDFDEETGLIVVEPGVTFADALRFSMPKGWVVPCAPGGLDVTLAGALSFDIHGKDGVRNGSFGDHVRAFKLLTADDTVLEVDEDSDKALFDLVIGGMGLFGIVVEVKLQLLKVPSSFLTVTKTSTHTVLDSLNILDNEEEGGFDYAIGWMDTFAPGNSVGRGFMTTAHWSDKPYDLTGINVDRMFTTNTKMFGVIESSYFWSAMKPIFRPAIVRWVNLAHYLLGRAMYGNGSTFDRFFSSYIYIHNMIPNVNYVYLPEGLVTCQPLIPREAGHEAFQGVLRLCQEQGIASMMAGLKRRRGNDRPVSFAQDGYSFSIDILRRRFRDDELNRRLEAIYDRVLDLGGLVYLAKDDRLPARYFKAMYPGWTKFWEMKEKVDPELRFMTDQARRIFEVK